LGGDFAEGFSVVEMVVQVLVFEMLLEDFFHLERFI